MNSNKSIAAIFIQALNPESTYTIAASVTGCNGTIATSPTTGLYTQGTMINLTATPDSGYQVKAWTGTDNDTSKDTTNTLTMNADHTVTVEFEPVAKAEEKKRDGGVGEVCFISTSVSEYNVPQGIHFFILAGIVLLGLSRITRKLLRDRSQQG